MSIKVVVAVGNKKIERFIAQMDTIDVLTTIRRKEAVLDAIINYNPHVVVLSRELSGKIEMTDVIRRCRSLKEKCRVVFIYGEIDTEYKYFLPNTSISTSSKNLLDNFLLSEAPIFLILQIGFIIICIYKLSHACIFGEYKSSRMRINFQHITERILAPIIFILFTAYIFFMNDYI